MQHKLKYICKHISIGIYKYTVHLLNLCQGVSAAAGVNTNQTKKTMHRFFSIYYLSMLSSIYSQLKEAAVFSDNPVYATCTALNKRQRWQLAGECSSEFSCLRGGHGGDQNSYDTTLGIALFIICVC